MDMLGYVCSEVNNKIAKIVANKRIICSIKRSIRIADDAWGNDAEVIEPVDTTLAAKAGTNKAMCSM